MKCSACDSTESKVLDSRQIENGSVVKRRRECLECGKRFTTHEIIESVPVMVIKKDGTRQQFDRSKIRHGLLLACEKRPVSAETIEKIVTAVEMAAQNLLIGEVASETIGDFVMDQLKETDKVAYVRFASVYRRFEDVETFMTELKTLLGSVQK